MLQGSASAEGQPEAHGEAVEGELVVLVPLHAVVFDSMIDRQGAEPGATQADAHAIFPTLRVLEPQLLSRAEKASVAIDHAQAEAPVPVVRLWEEQSPVDLSPLHEVVVDLHDVRHHQGHHPHRREDPETAQEAEIPGQQVGIEEVPGLEVELPQHGEIPRAEIPVQHDLPDDAAAQRLAGGRTVVIALRKRVLMIPVGCERDVRAGGHRRQKHWDDEKQQPGKNCRRISPWAGVSLVEHAGNLAGDPGNANCFRGFRLSPPAGDGCPAASRPWRPVRTGRERSRSG